MHALPRTCLQDSKWLLLRLDPRMFGHPNNRLRAYRMCYNHLYRKWVASWDLQELVDMILLSKLTELKLDYGVYLRPCAPWECTTERDLTEFLCWKWFQMFLDKYFQKDMIHFTIWDVCKRRSMLMVYFLLYMDIYLYIFVFIYFLSLPCLLASCIRCQQRHLAQFRDAVPNKGLYDLSANVGKRCRTETKDMLLPCLTTSSQLWLLVQWVTNIYNLGFPSQMSQINNHISLTSARPYSAHRCEKKKRLMLGEEQLAALGYPCLKQVADAANVESWLFRGKKWSDYHDFECSKFPTLSCGLFWIVMTCLFLRKKWTSPISQKPVFGKWLATAWACLV